MVVHSIHNGRPQTSKGHNHQIAGQEIFIHGSQEWAYDTREWIAFSRVLRISQAHEDRSDLQ